MRDAHEFQLVRPGHHGPTSITAKCYCGGWVWSVFTDASPPVDFEEKARARHGAHVPEARELDELVARLPTEPSVTIPTLDARAPHPPGYNARRATNERDETPYPVYHMKMDGTILVHPFGYRSGRKGRVTVLSEEAPLEDVQR